jgi:hypothetical protein|tara:strand:+ start:5489 stop:5884 length:396 start_codon:yes stop_codon:yes gene_type:complete
MHSNYKHIGRGLAESAASILKGETLNEELSAAQKKLPAGLQKAIAKKDGGKEDEKKDEGMKMASNHKMKKAEKEPYHPGDGEHNQEELSPAQKKIDKNNNGKVDGEDLAKLRAKKEQLEEVIRELESKIVE